MSRYIDADALKKTFELLVADENNRKWINGVIEMFPTAYDVEAVCEQIKKVGAIDRRGMIHMQAALEIVQKGGNTNEH